MRNRRFWFGLLCILWLPLLALPMGRTNLYLQAIEPGVVFPETDDGDDDFRAAFNPIPTVTSLPDPAGLVQAFPNDRDVLLANALASPNDKVATLDALISRFPNDATLLALRLEEGSRKLNIARYDNPGYNINWPGPSAIPDGYGKPSAPAEWDAYLALANRGAALEPDNTFFDWMRMAALYALHRDPEAIRVLNQTSRKTGFDGHARDVIFALFRAYGHARRLAPAEQKYLAESSLNDYFMSQLRDVTRCTTPAVIRARMAGDNHTALTDSYDLFHLGHLVRLKSYTLMGPLVAISLETITITEVELPQKAGSALHFPKIYSTQSMVAATSNLAGFALAMKRPDIAAEVAADWKGNRVWLTPLAGKAIMYNPTLPLEDIAATQERWGRLLLHTLPLVILLWALSIAGAKRWRFEDAAAAATPRQGVLAGGLVLLTLAAGDAAFAWRVGRDEFIFPDYARSPNLYTLAPLLVMGCVGGTFVILSFARARRWQWRHKSRGKWWPGVKDVVRNPSRLHELNLTPLLRLTAQCTLWLALAFAFGFFCADSEVKPGGNAQTLFFGSNLIPCLIWLVFLTGAIARWIRLPDRRRALALILLNLRQLSAGYLLAALLLYPVTALLILPVDQEFTAAYRAYLQAGENALVRAKFGL